MRTAVLVLTCFLACCGPSREQEIVRLEGRIAGLKAEKLHRYVEAQKAKWDRWEAHEMFAHDPAAQADIDRTLLASDAILERAQADLQALQDSEMAELERERAALKSLPPR